jgi:RNA polymerase sigma-70 factor (ECF subfamily)
LFVPTLYPTCTAIVIVPVREGLATAASRLHRCPSPVQPRATAPRKVAMNHDPLFAAVAEHQRTLRAEADAHRAATAVRHGGARSADPQHVRRRMFRAGAPRAGVDVAVVPRPGCRPAGCAGLCTGEGLAVVHRAYRAPLLGRATAILGDAGLAEEVVQETFLRAWRACAAFDPEGSPMLSWLCVIMRNLAFDRAKARGRRPGLLNLVPVEDGAPPTRLSDVDLMLLRMELRDALAGLHAKHRTAVVETILRDRPCDEVAAELGVPVGTLRSRAHYALRRLRRLLDDVADLAA